MNMMGIIGQGNNMNKKNKFQNILIFNPNMNNDYYMPFNTKII